MGRNREQRENRERRERKELQSTKYVSWVLGVILAFFPFVPVVPLVPVVFAMDIAAVVTAVVGRVQVRRAGTGRYVRLKRGDFLYEGDKVRTRRNGRAAVSFTKGLEIKVNRSTIYEIERPEAHEKGVLRRVRLHVGRIWGRLLHRGARAQIRTNTAVAAVRGTSADFENTRQEVFTVTVFDGIVDVQNAYGKTTLRAGQSSTVSSPLEPPSPARRVPRGELPDWQDEIEAEDSDDLLRQLEDAESPPEKSLLIEVEEGGEKKKIRLKFKRGKK